MFFVSDINAHGVDSGYEKRQQNRGWFSPAGKWRVTAPIAVADPLGAERVRNMGWLHVCREGLARDLGPKLVT